MFRACARISAKTYRDAPWGYVLRADPETVDLERFERLVTGGQALPARERNERLGAALAL